MDPRYRTLRRIRIEDASAAAGVFNLLMGSEVAPRRDFNRGRRRRARPLAHRYLRNPRSARRVLLASHSVNKAILVAQFLRERAWWRLDSAGASAPRVARSVVSLLDAAAYLRELPDDDPDLLALEATGCFRGGVFDPGPEGAHIVRGVAARRRTLGRPPRAPGRTGPGRPPQPGAARDQRPPSGPRPRDHPGARPDGANRGPSPPRLAHPGPSRPARRAAQHSEPPAAASSPGPTRPGRPAARSGRCLSRPASRPGRAARPARPSRSPRPPGPAPPTPGPAGPRP